MVAPAIIGIGILALAFIVILGSELLTFIVTFWTPLVYLGVFAAIYYSYVELDKRYNDALISLIGSVVIGTILFMFQNTLIFLAIVGSIVYLYLTKKDLLK